MATEEQILYIQRARKAQGSENRKIPKRLPAILHPSSIQTRYSAMLLDFVQAMGDIVENELFSQIPNYVKESDSIRPTTDSIEHRIDAWPTLLSNNIDEIHNEVNRLSDKPNEHDLTTIANDISNFNKAQVDKVIKQGLGVDVFTPEPWLEQEIEAFTHQNLSLMGSLEDEYLRKVEEAVNRGIQSGDRAEDIIKELNHIEGVTESRAKLIARDQVSKLNGNLNMLRQENLGIDSYIWRTSEDERVRPSHEEKNGKEFQWNNPPSDTGHPGEDYNCRCYAEPKLDGFLEGI